MSLFKEAHHVCIVVRDANASIKYYESLGVGPWQEYPSLRIYEKELDVPDRDAFFGMRYFYCNLSNFQLQLCQPAEGESAQWKFLQERGEGVFHIGFTVPDIVRAEEDAKSLGLETWMRGRQVDGSGFNYFKTQEHGAGTTLEIRINKLV